MAGSRKSGSGKSDKSGKKAKSAKSTKSTKQGKGANRPGGNRPPKSWAAAAKARPAGTRPVTDSRDWIYGLHAVESVLSHRPEAVESLWLSADSANPRVQQLAELAQTLGITREFKAAASLDKKCPERHQGVLAAVKPQRFADESDLAADAPEWVDPLVLVLDSIEDPRNLGACLRSADAAGCTAVILPRHKSAQITAVTRKTAAGAADSLKIYQVTNVVRALEILKKAGVWIAGSDCGEDSRVLYRASLTGPLAMVMGNEGKGLRPLVRQHCDFLVHIPMRGTVQSLNVAVATGVCLFEALRQREYAD
jgi:23S rRNA (guanosine2251-2'-O)-methyltransferase